MLELKLSDLNEALESFPAIKQQFDTVRSNKAQKLKVRQEIQTKVCVPSSSFLVHLRE